MQQDMNFNKCVYILIITHKHTHVYTHVFFMLWWNRYHAGITTFKVTSDCITAHTLQLVVFSGTGVYANVIISCHTTKRLLAGIAASYLVE